MEYTFTDKDRRSYKRKTKKPLTIKSEQTSSGKIEILFLEFGKSFFSLFLDKREVAGIISALSAATAECKCEISI